MEEAVHAHHVVTTADDPPAPHAPRALLSLLAFYYAPERHAHPSWQADLPVFPVLPPCPVPLLPLPTGSLLGCRNYRRLERFTQAVDMVIALADPGVRPDAAREADRVGSIGLASESPHAGSTGLASESPHAGSIGLAFELPPAESVGLAHEPQHGGSAGLASGSPHAGSADLDREQDADDDHVDYWHDDTYVTGAVLDSTEKALLLASAALLRPSHWRPGAHATALQLIAACYATQAESIAARLRLLLPGPIDLTRPFAAPASDIDRRCIERIWHWGCRQCFW